MNIIVPEMMKHIQKKDGINWGYAKNYHTVKITLNTGEKITSYAYETKTMTVIEWHLSGEVREE